MSPFSGVMFVLLCFVTTVLSPFSFLYLPFFCFFGYVAFSEYFLYHYRVLLYGAYVVCFFLPDGVFLPCDHGLDF